MADWKSSYILYPAEGFNQAHLTPRVTGLLCTPAAERLRHSHPTVRVPTSRRGLNSTAGSSSKAQPWRGLTHASLGRGATERNKEGSMGKASKRSPRVPIDPRSSPWLYPTSPRVSFPAESAHSLEVVIIFGAQPAPLPQPLVR